MQTLRACWLVECTKTVELLEHKHNIGTVYDAHGIQNYMYEDFDIEWYRRDCSTLRAFHIHILLHLQNILHQMPYTLLVFCIIYLGHYWILLAFYVIRIRSIWHVSRQPFTIFRVQEPRQNVIVVYFGWGVLCPEATCVLLFVTRNSRLAYAGIPFISEK